ncbi:MAG: guanylate kinase [Cyclobacteriaceae bacterium]
MGKAIIFCAPSGSGKTTIVKYLLSEINVLKFSISATTRFPRSNVELHGKDYYFLSEQEFRKKLASQEFYEWQEVYEGTFYGTLKSEVARIWSENNHVIFDLDVEGALNLKKKLGNQALAVFVKVKNIEVLRDRLSTRSTESADNLEKRITKAAQEMKLADSFDIVLLNDDLEKAQLEAKRIVKDFLEI